MTEAAIIDRLALPATLAAPEALLAVVLAAALGLLAGALATWALAARPAATARSAAETRAWGAERALAAAEVRGERAVQLAEDGARLRDALADAWAENATLTGTLEAERREHAARLEALTRAEASLADRFAHLASDALGANAERFLALVSERNAAHGAAADADLARRRDEVAALVTPLATTLARLETRVGEIETAREGAYRAIETQVGEIRRVNEDLRGETRRLVQALRAPKTRGRWGELHLRRVFELAGLVDHVDFATEVTLDTADGRLRPDAIVRLPGDRAIVVDAKTPLDAWLDAVEATDPAAEAEAMARHAAQVRAHLRQLSARAYWQHLPEAADFVVMFLPGEAFHAAAVEADPALMEEAFRARVLVATPTTLVGLLRAIAQGWQQTHLAANAREVAEAARDLHER
ncbi:MAG: DNA recombination protein RmuC, partial [Pseudomonadota bacterium]